MCICACTYTFCKRFISDIGFICYRYPESRDFSKAVLKRRHSQLLFSVFLCFFYSPPNFEFDVIINNIKF